MNEIKYFFDKYHENQELMLTNRWLCSDLKEIISLIMNDLPKHERIKMLNKIIDYVGVMNFLEIVFNINQEKIEEYAEIMDCLDIIKFANRPKIVKNIAILYYRIGNGGIERVISKITPILLDLGYGVTIFVEERRDDDYGIDKRAKIELVPKFQKDKFGFYTKKRFKFFEEKFKEYNIDLMWSQASSSIYLFYDLMFFKSLGKYFITTCHELFSQDMCLNNHLEKRIKVLKNVDFLQTLSKTEEVFWKNLGVNSKFISNPETFNIDESELSKKDRNMIIWVGRFHKNQKKPLDAIDIFGEVYKKNKDARMIMLGKGENKYQTKKVLNYIKKKGLEKVIKNTYTNDVRKYYRQSSLLLVTSVYETWSLVCAEAMSFNIPIISYTMPYLEMFKNNDAVITVDQGDKISAAHEICQLLENNERLNDLGLKARNFIKQFYNSVNHKNEWKKVFDSLSDKKENFSLENNYNKTILETIYFHYDVGVKKIKQKSKISKVLTSIKENGFNETFKKIIKNLRNKC